MMKGMSGKGGGAGGGGGVMPASYETGAGGSGGVAGGLGGGSGGTTGDTPTFCGIFAALNLNADLRSAWFRPVFYVGEDNTERPSFELTRDGFTLLAMGWTGGRDHVGALWKREDWS